MGHTVHDHGIENGLRAGCDECEHKTLPNLDSRNIAYVTGMPIEDWRAWVKSTPSWILNILDHVTAKEALERQGRYYHGPTIDSAGQYVIRVRNPIGWAEPRDQDAI